MRGSRSRFSAIASLAIVALTIPGGTSLAGHSSFHATVSGEAAATDNVFGASQNAEADLSFTVRPGGLFGYDGSRMSHDVSLEAEVIEFLAHSDAPSISLRTAASSRYTTSRYTTLTTTMGASNGVISALSARGSPDQTSLIVTPAGRVDLIQGDASEAFSWSSGRDLTISQTLFGRASRSDGNEDDLAVGAIPTISKSLEAGVGLGVDRSFRRGDSLSLELGASVLRLEVDADPLAVAGSRLDRQLNPRGRVAWRHDFSRAWSGTIDVGAVYVHPYGTDPDNLDQQLQDGIFPVVGGALAYTEIWGRAALQVRRDITPNLLLAQNTVNDTAAVTLAMPLPWLEDGRRRPRLIALGSFGCSRTQLIDSDSTVAGSFVVARLDLGVGYSPRPGFTYGLRYELFRQSGDDTADMAIQGFYRNTLSFTFSIRYPDRVAGGDIQRRRSNSVRADGKDLVPIGVDPGSGDTLERGGGVEGGGGDE